MPHLLFKTAYTSAILVVLSLLGTLTLHADPGVFDNRIVFGQSAALKGPAGCSLLDLASITCLTSENARYVRHRGTGARWIRASSNCPR